VLHSYISCCCFCVGVKLGSVKALAKAGLLAILAVTAVLTPTHRTTQVKQTMKSMPKTMETTLAIMLNSPQKTMAMVA
jgi:hypothetical protein